MQRLLVVLSVLLFSTISQAKELNMWEQTVDDVKKSNSGDILSDVKNGSGMLCYGTDDTVKRCYYFDKNKVTLEFRVVSVQYTSEIKVEPFTDYLEFLLRNEVNYFKRDPDMVEMDPEPKKKKLDPGTMMGLIVSGKTDISFAWYEKDKDLMFMLMIFHQNESTVIMRHWQKLSFLEEYREE